MTSINERRRKSSKKELQAAYIALIREIHNDVWTNPVQHNGKKAARGLKKWLGEKFTLKRAGVEMFERWPNHKYAAIPRTGGFLVVDVDSGDWRDIPYKPAAVIPTSRGTHLIFRVAGNTDYERFKDSTQIRKFGCKLDIRWKLYAKIHDIDAARGWLDLISAGNDDSDDGAVVYKDLVGDVAGRKPRRNRRVKDVSVDARFDTFADYDWEIICTDSLYDYRHKSINLLDLPLDAAKLYPDIRHNGIWNLFKSILQYKPLAYLYDESELNRLLNYHYERIPDKDDFPISEARQELYNARAFIIGQILNHLIARKYEPRNAEIWHKRRIEKVPGKALAKEYRLTKGRISQIVKAADSLFSQGECWYCGQFHS